MAILTFRGFLESSTNSVSLFFHDYLLFLSVYSFFFSLSKFKSVALLYALRYDTRLVTGVCLAAVGSGSPLL